MTNKLNYSFGKHTITLADSQLHTYHSMGVAPPYDVLSPIGDIVNEPFYIEDILTNLKNVMEDHLPVYNWGCV